MNFNTKVKFSAPQWKLNFEHKLLFIGSCFSNHIGNNLLNHKFKTLVNPFGIIYNPISIFSLLQEVLNKKTYTEKDIFLHNEVWSSFNLHSDFSNTSAELLLKQIKTVFQTLIDFLKETDYLFVTFGSAWAYLNNKNDIVANCHKLPQNEFKKILLSEKEIIDSFRTFYSFLKKINPKIKIVFTISPVRHIRDGLIENNRSKANLIAATHQIVADYKDTYYFPAYELVIDDLRDYRFYEQDLVHPNKQATTYVLEYFEEAFFSKDTLLMKKDINKVLKSLAHKVNHKNTSSYMSFKEQLLNQINKLEEKGFDFSKERNSFS